MTRQRPRVVLVHGFLGTPSDWDAVRTALGVLGTADTVAVDLLRCASSPECEEALARAAHLEPAHLADADTGGHAHVGGREHLDSLAAPHTDDLAGAGRVPDGLDALATALREELQRALGPDADDPESYVMCGYSLGGRVCLARAAQALADGAAHHAPRCVLIGADPGMDDPNERSLRAGRDHAHSMHLREDPGAFLASWYAQPLFASLRVSPSFPQVIGRRRQDLGDPDVRARWASILDACSPGRCAPRWGAAVALGSRIACLHGELDDKFAAIARRIHALSPATPTISIPHAGHAAHVEQPEACADALASILAAPFATT
jgi:2-succinyl-6-hydroxy-2,4-cyclohexadiene-1-carboxylate synthase